MEAKNYTDSLKIIAYNYNNLSKNSQTEGQKFLEEIHKIVCVALENNPGMDKVNAKEIFHLVKIRKDDRHRWRSVLEEIVAKVAIKCPDLHSLDLSTISLRSLHFPSSLRSLNLRGCNQIPKEEFAKISSLTVLEEIDLSATLIDDLDVLPKHTIKKLALSRCSDLSAEKLKKLAEFSNLTHLNVSETKISELCISNQLKELNVSQCFSIEPKEFEKLDDSFSELELLDASSSRITKIAHLPKGIKILKTLGCEELTIGEIEEGKSLFKFKIFDHDFR